FQPLCAMSDRSKRHKRVWRTNQPDSLLAAATSSGSDSRYCPSTNNLPPSNRRKHRTMRVPSGNCAVHTCFLNRDKFGLMNSSHSGLIRLIAMFKLLKAACLIVVGFGILKLIHRDVGSQLEQWVAMCGFDPGSRLVSRAIERA